MDINNASWQDQLHVLQLMWRNDELSAEKLQNILNEAIDVELAKADELVDCVFIDKCTDLLLEISGTQHKPWKSHKKQNWRALRERIDKRAFLPYKQMSLMIVLAVVLVIGVVIVDAVIPKGRISTYSTPDEQLYVVQGEANKVQLMPAAMASLSEDEVLNMVATNIGEVEAFFGFMPPMPKDLPSGWTLDQYEGHITQTEWMFLMVLSNDAQDYSTTYQITASATYDGFEMVYHQNEVGSKIQLSNGLEGYLAYNFDNILITWVDGLTCYDVSGPISPEEALKTIESIK